MGGSIIGRTKNSNLAKFCLTFRITRKFPNLNTTKALCPPRLPSCSFVSKFLRLLVSDIPVFGPFAAQVGSKGSCPDEVMKSSGLILSRIHVFNIELPTSMI